MWDLEGGRKGEAIITPSGANRLKVLVEGRGLGCSFRHPPGNHSLSVSGSWNHWCRLLVILALPDFLSSSSIFGAAEFFAEYFSESYTIITKPSSSSSIVQAWKHSRAGQAGWPASPARSRGKEQLPYQLSWHPKCLGSSILPEETRQQVVELKVMDKRWTQDRKPLVLGPVFLCNRCVALGTTLDFLGFNFPEYKIGERRRKQIWIITNIYILFTMSHSSVDFSYIHSLNHHKNHMRKILFLSYNWGNLAQVSQELCVLTGAFSH